MRLEDQAVAANSKAGASGELLEVRLEAIRYATDEITILEFARSTGGKLPAVDAGSHIDIHLPNGVVRQYSVMKPSDAPSSYVIAVKREMGGRGGSKFLHDEIRVGAGLSIGHPRNHFRLNRSAPHSVLIAGGIGITPIFAMMTELSEDGSSRQLFYACRSPAEAFLPDRLRGLGPVVFHYDSESNGRFIDLDPIVFGAPQGSHFYCCGPESMLSAFERATAHLPSDLVHLERFNAAEAPATEGGFTVELAQSRKTLSVPEGKTILEVVRAAGVEVMTSCESGVCGSCETEVLDGTPDHRDNVLTASEKASNRTMMVCCSGSKSPRLKLNL